MFERHSWFNGLALLVRHSLGILQKHTLGVASK